MLEISCPACGAGGRVPRNKMNVRLVCKKCLRVFHLSPGGQAVMGEPPVQKDVPQPKAARESSGLEMGGSFDDLTSRLGKLKLPKIDPRTLGIVGGVVLAVALGFWFFSRQTLEQRTENLAKAIMTTDMKGVLEMNLPGTEMETMQWFNETYKRYMDLKLALGGQDAGVKINVLSDGTSGPAVVVLQLSSEGLRFGGSVMADALQPRTTSSNSPPLLELHLYWVKGSWGNWVLDGKRTYEGKP
jgi:hypothetical protein